MSFIFCPHYLPSYCCREEQGEGEERNNRAVHMHASIIYFFVLGPEDGLPGGREREPPGLSSGAEGGIEGTWGIGSKDSVEGGDRLA